MFDTDTVSEKGSEVFVEHKLYKRRWIMLLLFTMFVFNGTMQWTQFTIISNIIEKYYNVPVTLIEWTAVVFTVADLLLIIPSIYIIDYLGVRNTMITGAVGVVIGTWIKSFAVAPDRFVLIIIGQIFCSSALMFPFALYGRIPALWFGMHEISTAGVIAMLGDELGGAAAFFLPTLFVKDGTLEEIEQGLGELNWFITAISTVLLTLILLLFESRPDLPPSMAQAKKRLLSYSDSSWSIVKKTIKQTPKKIILMIYFTLGPYTAILTTLNEIISPNFPNQVDQSGYIGSIMMLSGTIGSLIVGHVLDSTRKYKQIGLWMTICLTVSMACFTYALKLPDISYVYVASVFVGIFNVSFYVAVFQVGLELTYPLSEVVLTACFGLAVETGSFFITVIYGYALEYFGDLISNIGLTLCYFIGTVFLYMTPNDLHRTAAEKLPIKRDSNSS